MTRQLPMGWELKKLGESCTIRPPKSEARNKLNPDDMVSFVPMESLGIEQKNFVATQERLFSEVEGSYTYFADNDVLLAKITPCFENGKLGIAKDLQNGIGFGSSEYIVFRTKDFLYNEFLYYFLAQEEFRVNGAKNMSGAVGHKRVAKDFIEQTLIPIPPVPEQKRIVAILDEAFTAIAKAKENAEKNLKNARELFESYLQNIFANPSPDWEETTLGANINLMTGFPFKSSNYTQSLHSIRLLRGDNIIQGKLRWDDVKNWSLEYIDPYISYHLQKDDVVLAMDRPWVKGGLKRAMISENDLPCLLVQRTACLRSKETLNNRFLFFLISSNYFTQHILGVQTGSGVPHISGKQINDFNFMKPSLLEQHQIVSKLDALSAETKRLETIYKKKLSDLEGLKKSILQKAFSGELTEVNQ